MFHLKNPLKKRKNQNGNSGKRMQPVKMQIPKQKGDLQTASKLKQFDNFLNKNCKHKCFLCQGCCLDIRKIIGEKDPEKED